MKHPTLCKEFELRPKSNPVDHKLLNEGKMTKIYEKNQGLWLFEDANSATILFEEKYTEKGFFFFNFCTCNSRVSAVNW